jgi:hypothetical protein
MCAPYAGDRGPFMTDQDAFRWWEVRRAQNLKPTTYICPLRDQQLYATSEHTLLLPEGDPSQRRHAHTDCVAQARRAGKLLTERRRPDTDESDRRRPTALNLAVTERRSRPFCGRSLSR